MKTEHQNGLVVIPVYQPAENLVGLVGDDLRSNFPSSTLGIRRFIYGVMRPVFATPFSRHIQSG